MLYDNVIKIYLHFTTGGFKLRNPEGFLGGKVDQWRFLKIVHMIIQKLPKAINCMSQG